MLTQLLQTNSYLFLTKFCKTSNNLREAVLMKIQVLVDMHRVKRQRVNDDSRQPSAPYFVTSTLRRVKYYTFIFEDSNSLGWDTVWPQYNYWRRYRIQRNPSSFHHQHSCENLQCRVQLLHIPRKRWMAVKIAVLWSMVPSGLVINSLKLTRKFTNHQF
jgi:hypothetical protein